jgi:hypothetical protein
MVRKCASFAFVLAVIVALGVAIEPAHRGRRWRQDTLCPNGSKRDQRRQGPRRAVRRRVV